MRRQVKRQTRVGDTVRVQLSNGPLVQAYAQYISLYEIYKGASLEGKVVRVSSGGRISVEFKQQVIRYIDADNVNNTRSTVQNGFGKGKLGYCLYFETFDKFPYEVIEDEPEMKNVVIDSVSALDALERFKQQPWQMVESDYFAAEAKELGQYYQNQMLITQKYPPESITRDRDYYAAGVDPYQPTENINMQFVEPLFGSVNPNKSYGSVWIKSRRHGQSWAEMAMMQKQAIENSVDYAKIHYDLMKQPLAFLTEHQQQLLLLCP